MKTELISKTTKIKNIEMSYWETGSSAQPPIVYVHGNTGGKVWFRWVMEIPGYRVLAPDLPNFGESGHLQSAEIDTYADFLAEFVTSLGVSGAAVVGHSLGGAVSISLAVRYPELVGRLLLVDSAPLDGLHTPEEYYPVIETYKTDRSLLKKALSTVTPTLNDDAILEELTTNAMKMNPIAFAGNPRSLDRFDYRDRSREVTVPVLVVRGEQDVLITDQMASNTAAGFPGGRAQTLTGVGHSVMV